MELQGAKQCFDFLLLAGLAISVFIPDRHLGIAKWIREHQPKTSHFYDIWHVARSITKKCWRLAKRRVMKELHTGWKESEDMYTGVPRALNRASSNLYWQSGSPLWCMSPIDIQDIQIHYFQFVLMMKFSAENG